ncbi:MAG: SDR family oxidoreductase [Beijerinckiaceae bacterium]|jgi:NAD(P)-dependent dehydrogenase (short-subunit alcohol dehydrogenase family)|nr:SDR family oxidoreductase [Beijerinckiaceae bacterium]
MELNLKDKVVILTGPAKGMGAAITMAFAREGSRLVLVGRDTSAIKPVQSEAERAGAEAIIVPCDVTDSQACENVAMVALDRFGGRIDVLVNIAGGSGPIGKTGAQTTQEEFDEIVHLNMCGPFNMIRAVAPAMQKHKYGKIVNIGGTFGMRGRAGRMAYSSSKWGLRGITKSFALELGGDNINVNCVAPGMVDGPRFRSKVVPEMAKRLDISEDEAAAHHASDYALKRISNGDDVAHATLFLASDVSRQITGTDIPVDGGWAVL